ncbi:uncharacterized protein LOC116121131 [Pistacia vera]|uniref:uncharacterized protein LOC116121131 n=1 Tax=Pistacia vera TaxID=55513 RepID=UPI0012630E2D|nr:uncharacterized protein LOC116121131 [Pistacia vera]
MISAEIPDKESNPLALVAVENYMIHGPCGDANKNSPCMHKGKCQKHFPKKFVKTTIVDDEGYPVYRRWDTGAFIEKKGVKLNNLFVAPYNRNLLTKFDAHINAKIYDQHRSVKGYFNLIPITENWQVRDYHSTWRTNKLFYPDKCLVTSLESIAVTQTKLIEWMKCNDEYPQARSLTYSNFPSKWVWNATERKWTERKNGKCIGRIYFAYGEKYYLRMLLNLFKGAISCAYIRAINGVIHPIFKDACYSLGLLDDGKEWNVCLDEASVWASGSQLQQLFVTILLLNEVVSPTDLWRTNAVKLSEDMAYILKRKMGMQAARFSDEQLQNHALIEIEDLLKKRRENNG